MAARKKPAPRRAGYVPYERVCDRCGVSWGADGPLPYGVLTRHEDGVWSHTCWKCRQLPLPATDGDA